VDAEAIWLVIGVVLVLTEIISLTLVLGMLGVGALVAAGLALAGLGLVAQLIGFAGASAAMLLLVRPPVKAALDTGGTTHRTDARMLQGSSSASPTTPARSGSTASCGAPGRTPGRDPSTSASR
jgi:membrane protein implicated in regulation of membrane protease activity